MNRDRENILVLSLTTAFRERFLLSHRLLRCCDLWSVLLGYWAGG
ncbi:hypothetical protein M595_1992 [Lyngbya aestuarii BL J]|uniref:Uncharacterized protein n=1 Tax=Lyngbya aestuarii BL J TaxID=1348334 RepID=U7QNN6_9CYAN|nr:hypothetical protein M595_1992 [Lyngbya aestuarii BL J]